MIWKRFINELPTLITGDQKEILFGHPKWATYMRGMYTHWPEESLNERLSVYQPDIDKFYSWESMEPTHWILLPENPTIND